MSRNKNLTIPGPVPYEKIQDLHTKVDSLHARLNILEERLAENTRLTQEIKNEKA
jgi:hypothetical protein